MPSGASPGSLPSVKQGENSRGPIVVGMSGGVDSSVAAALLKEQGFDVIGITMKTYDFDHVGGNLGNETSCCGLDAFNDARMVAVQLGIPHYVVDFTSEFSHHVIDNFVDEYLKGKTPNPCIICNREVKWGALLAKAKSLGAGKIATGHYARIRFDETAGRYRLFRGAYDQKDQSYALWGLTQDALAKTAFPLGELTKPEVRALAVKFGLRNAAKDESFEICFVADNDYRRFIKERMPHLESSIAGGNIVLDGKPVGKHTGFTDYTIGQKKGIGAHKERMYVTDIDPDSNTVTIGRGDELLKTTLTGSGANFLPFAMLTDPMDVLAQVRYKDVAAPARIEPLAEPGAVRVTFASPKRAITPGQSVVFYRDDELIGGAVIDRTR